ncbi:hypothetical protein MJO29_001959 [Puccinia striiformis f. sp. tritici]|nr:hypothetical protein MJO29_001959 [Puccinia striiformis f. sp. tritici]
MSGVGAAYSDPHGFLEEMTPNMYSVILINFKANLLQGFSQSFRGRAKLHLDCPKTNMLVTLRKSTFFCFVCFVLGPCQFTLSSLDGEAHAAQEALSRFPGLTRLDSSNSITVNVPGSHMKDRLDPKHYGAIPQKLAQRKAELKSMEIEDRAIKDSIIYMSGLQFDDMKMRLVELHNALKVYVEARVFRLSGKGSAFTGLLPKTNLEGPKYAPTLVPLHSSASSHGSRTTQFPKEEPSPETGSQRRKSARKSKIIELIGNTLPFDKFSSRIIAHQENHGGVSTTGQTGVQDSLGGSGTQLGKMVMHSGRVRGELAGDELSIKESLSRIFYEPTIFWETTFIPMDYSLQM